MGTQLVVQVTPVAPDQLMDCDSLLEDLLLTVLNDGDAFKQTTYASLKAHPVVLAKGDHAVTLLRGAVITLPTWADYLPKENRPSPDYLYDLRSELAQLLALIDERGSVQIAGV